jgi:hypothetical protein
MKPFRPRAVEVMRKLGLEPDPWQVEVLEGNHPRLLLNCCRQAGKSTVVALLGLVEAVFVPGTKVLLVSRSFRQSAELFRIVADFYRRLGQPLKESLTSEELRLGNRSRIVCVPCKEETIRGYSHISLLVIDEAARVFDEVYRAVRPMLAVSGGRLICLSTPYGKRGFFYDAWARGGADWARIEVPAERIPRIPEEFLQKERRALGELFYRQEYGCSFEALEGLVYPDFARCVVHEQPPPGGRKFGGMDFGFRNPFAAVWGLLDRDGLLWLTGEHYVRQQPLSYHVRCLPRDVTWYADPSGAASIAELRVAGVEVRKGNNALRLGIEAVTARLLTGTLKVVAGACPNLVAEAGLYRYGTETGRRETETPQDSDNHALDALRYLVSKLDARYLARGRTLPAAADPEEAGTWPPRPQPRPWLRYDNEQLWTQLD